MRRRDDSDAFGQDYDVEWSRERLESVIGRAEDKELPMFESGAFDIEVRDISRNGEKLVNRLLPLDEILRHTMRHLIDSIRLVSTIEFHCSEFFKKIVLISHKTSNHMVVCYPSTPKKLVMTLGCFLAGVSLFAVGVHLSYINVAPQQSSNQSSK